MAPEEIPVPCRPFRYLQDSRIRHPNNYSQTIVWLLFLDQEKNGPRTVSLTARSGDSKNGSGPSN